MELKNIWKLVFGPAAAPAPQAPPYYQAFVSKQFDVAYPLVKAECGRGNTEAMNLMGTMYTNGLGVEIDYDEAALWFRQAAIGGNHDAQAALGAMLTDGKGAPHQPEEAAYWLYQAAKAGHSIALDWLSDLVLAVPSVVGMHFNMQELTDLLRKRGRAAMLRAAQ